ncbi:MAG: SRPBCC family protein [Bdellovibrionia bacterium]
MQISVTISASVDKIWEALTRPELIEKYLFGTTTETDWQPGSPIYFRGVWEGKPYEDKGKVLEFQKPRRISYTHWSSFSGKPDLPENYVTVTYELRAGSDATEVSVSQDCLEQEQERCETNWKFVLESLKKLLES